ncbi:hypothetical protein HDU96_009656 [Phlyctochytrium bullatum]|nr:hypothetical protein HDU96_009656 [Phlyctochytrium bullatum]
METKKQATSASHEPLLDQDVVADEAEADADGVAPAAEKHDELTDVQAEGEAQQPSLLEEVWLSIFTPGVNGRVQFFMDMCFYALFASLILLLIASEMNPHVIFLTVISVCLFASVKWFVWELQKVKDNEKKAEQVSLESKKDK